MEAKWQGLEVTLAHEGKQLFFDFFGIGDVHLLLADITDKIGVPPGKNPIFRLADPNWTL
jgi:hypothetical protein